MITLYVNCYTKGGREMTRAFTYATEAAVHAKEILADVEVAAVTTWRYQASGTFKDAMLLVMSSASAPKESWADQRVLQYVSTRRGTMTRRV